MKFFDINRGFGFVECYDDNQDYFIHIYKIITPPITENEYVVFQTIRSRKKWKENEYEATNLYKLLLFNADYSFLIKSYLK